MPVCAKCGTWNQDAAVKCDKCGVTLSAAAEAVAVVAAGTPQVANSVAAGSTGGFAEWRRKQATLLAVVLVFSMIAGVLLVKSAASKYDASGQCVLDSNYTVETKTKNGSVESVKYLVDYTFNVQGVPYTGKDKLDSEPTAAEVAVYYMASNPRENSLSQNRLITLNLVAAGVAFLIALIAYGMLPRKVGRRAGLPEPAGAEGVGDSGYEPARMKHGKYSAWVHVHLAFFVQAGLTALVVALVAVAVSHADPTSYWILGVATLVSLAVTLWVYTDRWCCIEAFSSRFCSGVANLSLFYVPGFALVYANYRGLKKLMGR